MESIWEISTEEWWRGGGYKNGVGGRVAELIKLYDNASIVSSTFEPLQAIWTEQLLDTFRKDYR